MPATEGSTATFDVISNVSWLVASDQSWLTPDMANGTGNGTVTLTAGKNESINGRTATITVSATVAGNSKKVWDFYTLPKHIVNWNFASSDWHCPQAETISE